MGVGIDLERNHDIKLKQRGKGKLFLRQSFHLHFHQSPYYLPCEQWCSIKPELSFKRDYKYLIHLIAVSTYSGQSIPKIFTHLLQVDYLVHNLCYLFILPLPIFHCCLTEHDLYILAILNILVI